MQRSWITAFIVASGLLAQTPPPEPPPAPAPAAQAPESQPAPKAAEPQAPAPEAKPFDQWRPTQRKYAYTLERALLAAHELGYYRSHPQAIEVRDALETLVSLKDALPEKAQAGVAPAQAYLDQLYANHGLYDADGKKLLMGGTWKALLATARAAAKAGARAGVPAAKGLDARLARMHRLLFDPKMDAAAPTWAEPAPAKGKKARRARGPKVPAGFAAQKAVTLWWVRQALHYVPDTPQEVDVKGVKKPRLLPDPAQAKPLSDLAAWLDREDLDVLRDPGFGWLDLRRLVPGTGLDQGQVGLGLLAKAADIAASKAPEGTPGALPLLPVLQPVMAESKFSKGDEKRLPLGDVKLLPPAATLPAQMVAFEQQARTREFDVK
ncbi:MAG TPA: hypothetical protein VF768_09110 [Holophagaceae bacterium]